MLPVLFNPSKTTLPSFVAGAADAAHHQTERAGVVDAVRGAEAGAVVVEGAAAQAVLAFGGDGVGAGIALSAFSAKLFLRGHDFVAGAGDAAVGVRTAVGVRIVEVLEPLPDIARHVEVAVRASAVGARSDVGRSRSAVDAA